MICCNDHFKTFLKNNEDLFTNGVRIPGHLLPKFTSQIKIMPKNVLKCSYWKLTGVKFTFLNSAVCAIFVSVFQMLVYIL